MTQANQTNYLYLYCTDLKYFPQDYSAFINECQQKGLITPSNQVNQDEFLVGDEFLQHVTFMGCSPYLKVYPDNDQDNDFCRVSIPSKQGPVQYQSSQQVSAPRCPVCRKTSPLAETVMQQWQRDKTNIEVICSHCEQASTLYQWDWRRNAGFYQFHIRISNIFPKEAIPGEALLAWLEDITKRDWKYFYA